jgi:hypothetical protein
VFGIYYKGSRNPVTDLVERLDLKTL